MYTFEVVFFKDKNSNKWKEDSTLELLLQIYMEWKREVSERPLYKYCKQDV